VAITPTAQTHGNGRTSLTYEVSSDGGSTWQTLDATGQQATALTTAVTSILVRITFSRVAGSQDDAVYTPVLSGYTLEGYYA
jgi:hypothetical protein